MEGDPEKIEPLVHEWNWKFSAIAGDIVLGDGVKCYATRHYNAKLGVDIVLGFLHNVADDLEKQNVKVIRRKVEMIIYDDRSSKVKPCDGGCIECHLDDYGELNGKN